MPEGPEIRRAADEIEQAIARQPLTGVLFAFEHLKPYESKLAAAEVVAVETKGKAMMIRFSNQLTIYSHNQLYGQWFVRKAHSYPQTNRQLRLSIHTAKKSALLYSASEILVLTEPELVAHPFIRRSGPDVLSEAVTVEQVADRFLEPRFARRQMASLLLDQAFLCGLGNYLRSEILFVAKIHPLLRPIHCTPAQIAKVAEAAIAIPYQSYQYQGITNDLTLADQLRQQGYSRQAYRHFVFGRDGQPCFICGTHIIKAEFAGRRCYYCPNCQAEG